jgi:hypothetical protein
VTIHVWRSELEFSGLPGVSVSHKESKGKARATSAHGGARLGAGRPAGSFNALPLNAVGAVKACRLRVPAGATPEAAELADLALQRIVDVMLGQNVVPFVQLGDVLKAASIVRNEVCGPIAQKLEHSGADGGPLQVSVEINLGGKK